MDIQNKVINALNRVTSEKEMEALFRKFTFEEYQATMEDEDSAIEVESLETQQITLVTGCEIECTLESYIEEF